MSGLVGKSSIGNIGGGTSKKSNFTVNSFHTFTQVTTLDRWYTPGGISNQSTLERTILVIPYACTVSNLKIYLRTNNLGLAQIFTVQKDTGSGMVDTAVTVSLPNDTTKGLFEDVTHTATFAAGDKIVLTAKQTVGGSGNCEIASILLEFNET